MQQKSGMDQTLVETKSDILGGYKARCWQTAGKLSSGTGKRFIERRVASTLEVLSKPLEAQESLKSCCCISAEVCF